MKGKCGKAFKRGGHAAKGETHASHHTKDGGKAVLKEAAESKNIGVVSGSKSKGRADRKRGGACRASGGGADASPYSSAGRGLRGR
jgi:hypothetical protein